MNCKQGDIAIIVKSCFGHEGKIVQCLRLATDDDLQSYSVHRARVDDPVWIIDIGLKSKRGDFLPLSIDSRMRPIRDNPGADQTLS